jgi:hypothetical protein
MRVLTAATSPIGLGLTAAAIGAGVLIQRQREQAQAARELEQAYRDVAAAVNDLMLSGETERARILEQTAKSVRETTDAVDAYVDRLKEQRDLALDRATLLAGTEEAQRAQEEYHRLADEIGRLTATEEQQKAAQEALKEAFSDTRVDAEKLARRVDELSTLYRNGLITADQYFSALQRLPEQTAKFAKATEDTTDALASQSETLDDIIKKRREAADRARLEAKAQRILNEEFIAGLEAQGRIVPDVVRGAENAAEAWTKWNQQIDELITGALLTQGALQDIAPELDGIQAGFGRASDTIEGTVLQLNTFGQVRLSKANREALELARTLEHVEDAITRTEDAIQNNEEDLGMWQDRIRFVTDVVGGNTDELDKWLQMLQNGEITQEQFNQAIDAGILGPLTKLDALLAQGRITQEEYNNAKAAALHLIKRSAGGIQDENAELVDNLIALDKYVTLHDNADGAVKNLTDDQRGFIAAMGEARVQTFLQTLQLLKFLEATGAIPPEKVTKFIADSSAADPVIAAVAEDLGLLEGEHEITLTADNANQVLDDLNGKATAFVSLDGKEVHVAVETTRDALEFVKRNAEALDGKEVTFTINGDDGPVTKTLDDLRAMFPEEMAILLKFQPEGAQPSPQGSMVGPGARPLVPAIEPPPPVPVTAEDKTGPAVESAKTSIGTVSETAASEGTETGEQFATALAGTAGETTKAVDAHRQALNEGFRAAARASQAWGQAVGTTFDVALANALASNASLVYDTAYAVAYNAYLGAKAALGIRSPSRRAMELASNFGGTFADVLQAQAQEAGVAFSRMLASSLESGLSAPALRSLVETRQPAAFLPVSAPAALGAGRTTVLQVAPGAVQVSGVADPQRAADLAIERLYRVISRLDSGGAFA